MASDLKWVQDELSSYLRTCRAGGMPRDLSDSVEEVFAHFLEMLPRTVAVRSAAARQYRVTDYPRSSEDIHT